MPRGCLIADGVVIGPNLTLKPFDRLSKRKVVDTVQGGNNEDDEDDDDDSDLEEVEASSCFANFQIVWVSYSRSGKDLTPTAKYWARTQTRSCGQMGL